MPKYFKETMRNAQEFYQNTDCSVVAKMLDGSGFVGIYEMVDRPYYFTTKIEKELDVVYMEMDPCIHCCKEAVGQLSEYIAQINEKFMVCDFRIAKNGKVYIHTEQRFEDGPLSASTFSHLEMECIKRLDAFETVLEKLANLRLLTPEEADVNKVLEKHEKKIEDMVADAFAKIEKELENDLEERSLFDDEDGDGTDTSDFRRKPNNERAEEIREFLEKQREKRKRHGKSMPLGNISFEDIVDHNRKDDDE